MAKSLRSKWKRKMRAAKRERYGKKELEKLKMVLGLNTTDVEMKEEKPEDNLDDDVVIGEFYINLSKCLLCQSSY